MMITRPKPSAGALRSFEAPIRKYSLFASSPALRFSDAISSSAHKGATIASAINKQIRFIVILSQVPFYRDSYNPLMPRETTSPLTKPSAALRRRALKIRDELAKLYPDAHCALDYQSPLQLLIATILSAQC